MPSAFTAKRAYKNVPFFLSSRGYGIFVDSVRCIHFDMAESNYAVLSIIVPDSALGYYVIAGHSAGNDTSPNLKSIRAAGQLSHPAAQVGLRAVDVFGLQVR